MASKTSIRDLLYLLARILGDINAILKGKSGKRFIRRQAGKIVGKGMRKLLK